MSWIVSIPVWGDKYREVFIRHAVPALRAALEGFHEPVKFIIHTDKPEAVHVALHGLAVETHLIPPGATYVALQAGHADAIRRAAVGDHVVLLNADLIVSKNLFHSCKAHFVAGDKAIVTTGIRTAPGSDAVPIGAAPRDLLIWAWDHRHQIIRDLEWGTGGSMLPTNLFFISGDSVVLHGFHLHPVAILKEKQFSFISTIDGDLLDHFPREHIHVVIHPDDLAMLEISEPSRRFPVRDGPITKSQVANSMTSRASALHRWLFTFRIVIKGDGADHSDQDVARDILQILGPWVTTPQERRQQEEARRRR